MKNSKSAAVKVRGLGCVRQKRASAFTLIELLVVIAIIAILAARKVAQIFNLLYRGFAIRLAAGSPNGVATFGRSAECNSAIRQIANLGYEAQEASP